MSEDPVYSITITQHDYGQVEIDFGTIRDLGTLLMMLEMAKQLAVRRFPLPVLEHQGE
jgi:hypothetical protein